MYTRFRFLKMPNLGFAAPAGNTKLSVENRLDFTLKNVHDAHILNSIMITRLVPAIIHLDFTNKSTKLYLNYEVINFPNKAWVLVWVFLHVSST